jgi:hypothetical protein
VAVAVLHFRPQFLSIGSQSGSNTKILKEQQMNRLLKAACAMLCTVGLVAFSQTLVPTRQGGTGLNMSSMTGCLKVTDGVVSVSNANCSGGGGGVNPGALTALPFYDTTATVAGTTGLSTDTATKQAFNNVSSNYVALDSSGQATISFFPQHTPNKMRADVSKLFGPADGFIGSVSASNIISGYHNSQNYTANAISSSQFLTSWTTPQVGGSQASMLTCYGVGDCINQNHSTHGRGGGRDTDESTRGIRDLTDISNDYAGGLVTIGATTAQNDVVVNTTDMGDGHSFNYAESNFIADITRKTALNVQSVALCADRHQMCVTLSTPHSLGVSHSTLTTAVVDNFVHTGTCPNTTLTGLLYPRAGNNIGGGYAFLTDAKGTGTAQINGNYINSPGGAMVGYCIPVASTAGMTVGEVEEISENDFTFETVKVISVVDATHFTAFTHFSHGIGARVTGGGGVGYGFGFDADIIAPNTMSTVENIQHTAQRVVYPIAATTDSTHLEMWINSSGNYASTNTYAFSTNTPVTPLTITATISGGAITGLTGNFTQATFNNYQAGGTTGLSVGALILKPPVVAVSTDCSVPPVLGFTASTRYSSSAFSYTPYVVSGGTGGCTTATFTVPSTTPNPGSIYPIAAVWKAKDPNLTTDTYDLNGTWIANGNFIAFPIVHPELFVTGDSVEQTSWWQRQTITNQKLLYGRSLSAIEGLVGPMDTTSFKGGQFSYGLMKTENIDASREFFGPYPYGVPVIGGDMMRGLPNLYQGSGAYQTALELDMPPYRGPGYPGGGDVIFINCADQHPSVVDMPCLHNIFPAFNLFNIQLGGTSTAGAMAFDPTTGGLSWSGPLKAPSLSVNSFSVPTLTVGPWPAKLEFKRDLTLTAAASLNLCNQFGTGNYLGVGNCNTNNQQPLPDGTLGAGILETNISANLNNVSIGLGYPVGIPSPVYTGTAGSVARQYYLTSSINGKEGAYSPYVFFSTNSTAATLDGTHFVTLTCPTVLQSGYPAGTTYIAYVQPQPGSTSGNSRLGTCPIGGTLVDMGGGTSGISSVGPLHNYNATLGAGDLFLHTLGTLRFLADIYSPNTKAGISSPSAGVVSFDGATAGDGLGDIIVHSCTGCGGSGTIPSGTINQMLYYAASGASVVPLTLGTNLSISGGTLNASATAATNFNALTSGTNTAAAMVVGTGASLSATGSGTIVATSAPYSGLTGSVPTWNQNTTGNAATATNATTAANATAVGGVTITGTPSTGQVATATSPTAASWQTPATGGTVTAVSVATANGVSGSSSGGATPALTIVLGAITPTSVTSSGPISSTGTTQGLSMLGVGTGTIVPPTGGFPANYAGIIAPTTGTPHYLVVLPSVDPTAGQTLSVAAPTTVNGVLQAVSTWVTPAGTGITNIAIALPTTAIAANTCTTTATVTMTGLATTSAFSTAFATNPNAVTGWGASGGLTFTAFPTANTLNWSVCNQTAASITPGALSLNVGAR